MSYANEPHFKSSPHHITIVYTFMTSETLLDTSQTSNYFLDSNSSNNTRNPLPTEDLLNKHSNHLYNSSCLSFLGPLNSLLSTNPSSLESSSLKISDTTSSISLAPRSVTARPEVMCVVWYIEGHR